MVTSSVREGKAHGSGECGSRNRAGNEAQATHGFRGDTIGTPTVSASNAVGSPTIPGSTDEAPVSAYRRRTDGDGSLIRRLAVTRGAKGARKRAQPLGAPIAVWVGGGSE